MNWIVQNLEAICRLPLLAADARSTGAERRQKVAHGVSRGLGVENLTSPGGA